MLVTCFISFKVLNFGNSLTLIVINMIYFANIFPLSVEDNVDILAPLHTYIYKYLYIYTGCIKKKGDL